MQRWRWWWHSLTDTEQVGLIGYVFFVIYLVAGWAIGRAGQ